MDSPRAHTDAMPTRNTVSGPAPNPAASRVARPTNSSAARASSTNGSAAPTTLAAAKGMSWYALTAHPEPARSVALAQPAYANTTASTSRAATASQGRITPISRRYPVVGSRLTAARSRHARGGDLVEQLGTRPGDPGPYRAHRYPAGRGGLLVRQPDELGQDERLPPLLGQRADQFERAHQSGRVRFGRLDRQPPEQA